MLDDRAGNDFRAALATGAVLFNRADYKFVAGEAAEETFWLLGVEGLRAFDQIAAHEPRKESVAFAAGGYYVMRDGWSPTSNYLLFDCGPHGMANCGHAHADALAIELAANGQTVLVDPGTFTYTGSRELRDWFRGSSAHNTVTIDRESSSVPADAFSWKTKTAGEQLGWIEHERFTYVSGRHHGYEQLAKPGAHTRSILFLKHDYWILHDRVELSAKHPLNLWFHFDSTAAPESLEIESFAENGEWRTEEGWVSHCYGEKAPAPVRVFSATAQGDFDIVTFLLPPRSISSAVEQVEVTGGRGFELRTEHSRDLVIIRNRTAPLAQTASVVTDFDWAWLRFAGDSSAPEEMVLLGGSKLELNGKKIAGSAERVEHLYSKCDLTRI
jgi:hypothetical protein